MLIIHEFIIGLALGIEYFEEANGYIISLLLVRFIILPEEDDDDRGHGRYMPI